MTRPTVNPLQSLHARLAAQLTEQLRCGDAPWQRAVRPGDRLPYNAHNARRFHGVNLIQLMAQSREDPRWMTYEQAAKHGALVRSGERGTLVHCWQFHETRSGHDPVPLTHPRLASAVVFNAEQIDGLGALQPRVMPPTDGCVAVDRLLQNSGARVIETGKHARYDPQSDMVSVPDLAAVRKDSEQAAHALRALGHWTGHPERLARDVRAPMGSASSASEELRVAMYVMVCAHEFGLALPKAPRIELRDAWIDLLERDPLELGRAATDAEHMQTFLHHRGRSEQRPTAQLQRQQPSSESTMHNKPKQYLAVPYVDRHRAQALGARWDQTAKCMYVGPNAAPDALARWLPTGHSQVRSSDAREQFAAVLHGLGLEVTGAHPIMDGRRHRLKAEGDRGRETAGYYIGRLDGIPNGFAGNYRTGQQTPWSARGRATSPEQLAELRAQAAQAAAARAEDRRRLEHATATRVRARVDQLPGLTAPLPYLERKQIRATSGALVVSTTNGCAPAWWPFESWPCRDGTICLPACDAAGRVWTMQYIDPAGAKRFEPNGFKRGCFHVIGGRELGTADAFVIAEGYATATSIYELVREPRVLVLAGFDSGNLPDVAAGVRAQFPHAPIVVAGDNDARLLLRPPYKNVGLEKAHAAAAVVRGVAITPVFPRGSEPSLTDFNDLVNLGGIYRAAAARQLHGALERAREQLRSNADPRERTLSRGARS